MTVVRLVVCLTIPLHFFPSSACVWWCVCERIMPTGNIPERQCVIATRGSVFCPSGVALIHPHQNIILSHPVSVTLLISCFLLVSDS